MQYSKLFSKVLAVLSAIIIFSSTFSFALANPQIALGHVTGGSNISAADVTQLRRFVASTIRRDFINANQSGFFPQNADVNLDGLINSADVTLLRRHLADNTVRLGIQRIPDPVFPPGQRLIAITFDDGPNRTYTVDILNELQRLGARASFYVMGEKIEGNEDIIRRMHREGHDVENHSWSHPTFGLPIDGAPPPLQTAEQARYQIRRTNDAIYSVLGVLPWSFRAPFFEWGNMLQPPGILYGHDREFNLAFIDSALDPEDFRAGSAAQIANWVTSRTAQNNNTNGDGGIILLHDCGGSRRHTVNSLGIMIPELHRQGYEVVTVRQLFENKDVSPEQFTSSDMWPRVNQWGPARRTIWETVPPLWPNWPQGPNPR